MYNTAPHYRPALPTRPRRRTLLGVSLVELLISLALGLVVLAGATGLFVGTIRSNAQLAASVDLNQDISSSMTLITNELRRAGYGREQANETTPWDILEPEARINIVTHDDGTFHCVLFAYDRDDNGTIDARDNTATPPLRNEWFGFLFEEENIWMRIHCDPKVVDCHASCARSANNRWQPMLPTGEVGGIRITKFSIDTVGSQCVHAGSGDIWRVDEVGENDPPPVIFPCRQWAFDGDDVREDRHLDTVISGMTVYRFNNTTGQHEKKTEQTLPGLCEDQSSIAAGVSPEEVAAQETFMNGAIESIRLNINLTATTEVQNVPYQKVLRTSVKVRNEAIYTESPTGNSLDFDNLRNCDF